MKLAACDLTCCAVPRTQTPSYPMRWDVRGLATALGLMSLHVQLHTHTYTSTMLDISDNDLFFLSAYVHCRPYNDACGLWLPRVSRRWSLNWSKLSKPWRCSQLPLSEIFCARPSNPQSPWTSTKTCHTQRLGEPSSMETLVFWFARTRAVLQNDRHQLCELPFDFNAFQHVAGPKDKKPVINKRVPGLWHPWVFVCVCWQEIRNAEMAKHLALPGHRAILAISTRHTFWNLKLIIVLLSHAPHSFGAALANTLIDPCASHRRLYMKCTSYHRWDLLTIA